VQAVPEKKYIRYPENDEFHNEHYESLCKLAKEDKETYYDQLAQDVHWHKKYT